MAFVELVKGAARLPVRRRWIGCALFALALSALTASPVQAADCSEFPGGIIDGFAGDIPPSQLQIDTTCTIRNFPASNPLSTNFSFLTQPGQTDERWVVIFDNVVHTGQMACNAVAGHKIWFTNGSSTSIQEGCQNLLIPVEKIDKQTPPGQTTAAIGVPFAYTLTMPVLFDPATSTVINTSGSVNTLHGVTLTDDLNATGVDLTYVSHVAYWQGTGTPVPHTFTDVGGLLTFDNFPIVPAGEQIILEITVVLDDTPANAPGTQFINTAKWDFGRLIDGEYYEPLPGEWGISPPLTIAAPDLVLTKTGPAAMNLGQLGDFTLDVQNIGNIDAWNATVLDRLPDGPGGGMCAVTPIVTSAGVFAADGVTPIPGKGALSEGTDFWLGYSGAPSCELTLTMLTSSAAIGPNERLIIDYQTQLDPGTQEGVTLTNVAGAIEWFNAAATDPIGRVTFDRLLTDGTVGVLDHEDAHTVGAALAGIFFEKSVENLTSGVSPTMTASPGDALRYTLRLQTTDGAVNDFTFRDDLGQLNATAVFEPGTLALVPGTIPPGADTTNTDPNGGTNGTGLLDIRSLSLAANSELLIQFDITLDSSLIDGTLVTNQADLLTGATTIAVSDDPNINGQSDPDVSGDEDPTQVVVEVEPPTGLQKANTQATAAVGEAFSYQITVPATPHAAPIYDVRIIDDLTTSAADLQFISTSKVSGSGAWTPVNTGTATNLVLEDLAGGIDIPAGEQVVVEVTVVLEDTATNVAGLTFTNTAAYTYNLLDGDGSTERPGDPGTSPPMTIVEPELTLEKSGPAQMRLGLAGTFTLDVHNPSQASAFGLTITDQLANSTSGGLCDAPPTQFTAQVFESDGLTPVSAALTEGVDFVVNFSGDPACTFTLSVQTTAGALAPSQRLIVTYQAMLDLDSQETATLTNVAGATEWFSSDVEDPLIADLARTYTRILTDGTVNILDHEDAHTLIVFLPELLFEKTVANVTSGQVPGILASPGDTLRYSLRVENLTDTDVTNLSIVDELDRLNASPAFVGGTLNLITVPAGADTANTAASGGASGTGLLDVRNLGLSGVGDSFLIEFEIVLAPVIANASYVLNQSQLMTFGTIIADSDDPNVNGPANPMIPGDEDPTQILIESAPSFDIDKVSAYVTGDPNVLLAGETLRYTITVKNIGTDNATDAVIRDQVPANTAYVAGSTTLNGAAVTDGAGGTSPLANGVTIYAPEDPTPGAMRADASATQANVATVVFDVIVDANAIDGTIISNQAFVSAVDGGVSDQPSDDPRTPVVDDPTRDIVGNLPLLFSEKSAALLIDAGSPGIVDPGDTLRYTIAIHNNGGIPATNVTLTDAVPADTTYVADSLTLNGIGVGQPDGGISPLVASIPVSSADLTPPLPAAGDGIISAGESAVIEFDLRVNDGVPSGTLIINQAVVGTEELPDQLTDGDGNPATGPEPTVVVVGNGQQLSISKQVAVVGGGAAIPGAVLEYVIEVVNIAAVPALYVELTDDLDLPVAGQLTFVDQSWTMNGSANGITINGSLLTADYDSVYGALDPGESIVLRFQAVIDPNLPFGTTITNTGVVTWNLPPQTASASVSIDVGGTPGSAILNGTTWHDADFDNSLGGSERVLEGWTVELYRNDSRIHTTVTDLDGVYRIAGIPPNYLTEDLYELRFIRPGAGINTAMLGEAYSADFTNALQRIGDIVVQSGANLQNLDLPIDPNGTIYDSVRRVPIPGAVVTLVPAGSSSPLPSSCFDDPAQQNQVTLADGYYKFDLNFNDAACSSGAGYVINVTAPATGYVAGRSEIIPPGTDETSVPFDVPACPGSVDDAIVATTEHCEAQPSELTPPTSVQGQSAGTLYYAHLTFSAGFVPGSSQIFNNHIPLDPELDDAISITKMTPMLNVTRGQLVPYIITINNDVGFDLQDVNIVDSFPPGFRYIEGSARLDGVPTEPTVNGRDLIWGDLAITTAGEHKLELLLGIGSGVNEGEYVNRAFVINGLSGNALSGEASATVRLVPDPTFDCTDVIGKVFDDRNRNGFQDLGERGIGGVRVATARGLSVTSDAHGRFHITCAIVPREGRGSNFVMKIDDRTLPSGFRASTDAVKVQRATRGKTLRFNFGASIHRVIGLDIADPVFEVGSVEMRPQWKPRMILLLEELEKAPATLRLSYLADVEDPQLVDDRLKAVKQEITAAWEELDCCYELEIEEEVFWRLGAPPEQPRERANRRRRAER